MILFWNNTYYSNMATNGDLDIEDFTPPQPYYYVINYLVGLVFMSSFFIGVGLNPFIIMFNWSKRQSCISLLFVITAAADLIVCILIPMFYAVLMVQPRIVFYNYMYEMYIVCVMCTFGCTSQVCTTMLGVVRFIKIMNPFYRINNTYVVLYLLSHILYMFIQVVFIILLILNKIKNDNDVLSKLVIACFVISALHCFVGSLCSGITVVKLYRKSTTQDDETLVEEKQKSAMTIFLMNIPHFVTAGCIFTSLVSANGISWFDINFIFCPILTATLNPLLIVSRGSAIQRMIRNKVRGARSAFTSDTDYRSKSTSAAGRTVSTHM